MRKALLVALVATPLASKAYFKSLTNCIAETNVLVKQKKQETIPGVFLQAGFGRKKVFLSTMSIIEQVHGITLGKVSAGPSIRFANSAYGIMVGPEFSHGAVHSMMAPWMTWRSKNGQWSVIAIGLLSKKEQSGIFEVWNIPKTHSHARIDVQFGVGNHGPNVGPLVKCIGKGTAKGWYIFGGPTTQIFCDHIGADIEGGVQFTDKSEVWFPRPNTATMGMHIALGYEM